MLFEKGNTYGKGTRAGNKRKGKEEMTFTFKLSDIAKDRGVTLGAIYQAIARKKLNPHSLTSIITYCVTDGRMKKK